METLKPPRRFQDGGSVRRGSFYVERRADGELTSLLSKGELCYVLAPRQIGKSSLRIRTEERLREAGVRCASIDLTRIGTAGITADEWYYSLIEEIAGPLRLDRDPAEYWARRRDLSPVHRFLRFLLKEVLTSVPDRIVISIDEIDMVLSLPFSRDDFFAAIRSIYNARAEDPSCERLTFCLFGVATPGELMEDPTHTPFNIGKAVRLDDFTASEAEAFLPGLEGAGGDPRALLTAVLAWTSGHPYMTQRVCAALLGAPPDPERSAEERVRRLVKKLFLERGRIEDSNLAYAERRLQKGAPGPARASMLRIYRRLLYGAAIPVRGDDRDQQELRLAGLVSESTLAAGARLVIRNRIFATVFDLPWIDENTFDNPIAEPVAQWLRFDKQSDFLVHGVALEVALDWARGRNDLSAEDREFIDTSVEAESRRKAEERASRDLRIYVALCSALVLLLLAGVTLTREHAYRVEAEHQKRDADTRLVSARTELKRVKEDADSKAIELETRAIEARDAADRLDEKAREKEQLESEAARLRTEARLARRRADEEHAAYLDAKKLADEAALTLQKSEEAAEALKKSAEAALVAEQALEIERAGHALADKQLADERRDRRRVEADLKQQIVELGNHQCWPEDAPDRRSSRPRGAAFDAPLPPPRN